MQVIRALTLFCVAWFWAAPAQSHHSSTAVDMTRRVTITGTVKEFVFANPHCWVYVVVPSADGAAEEWGLEAGPVLSMVRLGVRNKTFKPGDKIEATLSPRRDGKPGGFLYSIKVLDTGQDYNFVPPSLPAPGG
jgi:hypothetical protein